MKSYKCRVEYLESTGTQYIDTGYYPNNATKYDLKTQFLSPTTTQEYKGIIGVSVAPNDRCGMGFYNGKIRQQFGSGAAVYGGNYNDSSYTGFNNATVYECSRNGFYINETLNWTPTKDFTGTSSVTAWLFNTHAEAVYSGTPQKLYYCKIYDNNILVRDMIPVLDNNGRPAMYDNVSGQLFYNQGTGEFTYGRKIIPVEYLESTGTQYIDTGFIPTSKTRWEYDYQFNNTSSSYIGNGMFITSPSTQRFAIGLINTSFNMSYGADNVVPVTSDTNRHNFIIDAKNMYWQIDNTIGTYATVVTAALSRSIYFFARNGGSLYNLHSGKLYGSKIYDNEVLVRDYIPAIDENNIPFMFDKVTNTIYENKGTGQFKFGANVEKNGSKKMLRKKLALMLATLKKKRPYYCEVEYLESTGTQYIDTGFKIDDTCGYDISWMALSANDTIIIGTKGTSDSRWVLSGNNNPNVNLSWNTNYGRAGLGLNKIQTAQMNYLNDRKRILNGIQITDISETLSADASTYNVCIFGGYWGSSIVSLYSTCRLYYAKMTKGNTLVRDFIPVLDWNMTPCMYDKITRKLFYNQGTGSFSYGREIHYVDYLESSGTQYIDTGIAGSSTLRIEMEGQKSGATLGVYFGAGTSDSRIQAVYVNGYNSARIGNVTIVELGSDTEKFNIVCDALNKTVAYNGTEYPFTYTSSLTNLNIFMFTRNQGEGSYADKATARCWSFKMWDNNTLVRDYIPAIDENGVGFMLDKVTHTIYDNAGTGNFKYPPVELDYLEGTGTQYINTGLDYFADFEVGIKLRESVSNKVLGNDVYHCLQRYNASNPYWYFSTGAGASYNYTTSTLITEYHVMKWKDNKIYADDVLLTEFTKDLNASNRMYLYTGDGTNAYPNMIYFCKLWNPNDGVLIRDYIPVIKDGVAGMWDKVNNTFYPNVGTNSFVAGKIKEDLYEN